MGFKKLYHVYPLSLWILKVLSSIVKAEEIILLIYFYHIQPLFYFTPSKAQTDSNGSNLEDADDSEGSNDEQDHEDTVNRTGNGKSQKSDKTNDELAPVSFRHAICHRSTSSMYNS